MLPFRLFTNGIVFMQLSRRQINVLIVNNFILTVYGYNLGKNICLCQLNMLKISSNEIINIDELAHRRVLMKDCSL